MKKTIALAAILTAVFFFSGCVKNNATDNADIPQSQPKQETQKEPELTPIVSEKFCRNDDDCACGRHFETGECFFGNSKYVDQNLKPCPDFCGGIDGKMKIKCLENECKQSRD